MDTSKYSNKFLTWTLKQKFLLIIKTYRKQWNNGKTWFRCVPEAKCINGGYVEEENNVDQGISKIF